MEDSETRYTRARLWLVVVLAGAVVVIDQLTKLWAVSALAGRAPVTVVGELIQLRLTYNAGAAFSFAERFTWVLTIITAAAVVSIGIIAVRARSRAWMVALGLILGGAATHLLDRLFRQPGPARGHVVDFIDYFGFFVGNVADISLVVGVALAMLLQLRGVSLSGAAEPAGVRPAAG
ncbi:signal peptidase II [Actinoplanes sp. NPDC023801]|uniref:signal peptidase II n=1 Tax=Actinoplanes sp. NPDC023801 TaxID=3154595 RepID=UPI0033E9AC9B